MLKNESEALERINARLKTQIIRGSLALLFTGAIMSTQSIYHRNYEYVAMIFGVFLSMIAVLAIQYFLFKDVVREELKK